MRFWVGVTDNDWFRYHARQRADEVNFWQPSGRAPFADRTPGMPFLFKLKSPVNRVVGGGFFRTFSVLPLGVAWDVFGPRNGTDTLDGLRRLLDRHGRGDLSMPIGCTVLSDVFYLPEAAWFALPEGAFPGNIVVGKYFDTAEPLGAAVMQQAMSALERTAGPESQVPTVIQAGFGAGRWVEPRIGQAAFRTLVTEAYDRRCAITGENTLVALEAAHIRPYAVEQCHDVRNGLLLRADFHKLFDSGLVGVTPELRVRVSPRIAQTYFNGKVYYRLDGAPLAQLPKDSRLQPDPERLAWHMEHCFQQ